MVPATMLLKAQAKAEDNIQIRVWTGGTCSKKSNSTKRTELKEPELERNITLEEELLVAHKGLGSRILRIVSTVRKRPTDSPKGQATTTGIQQIPENHVLDVLGADGPGAEHLCSDDVFWIPMATQCKSL